VTAGGGTFTPVLYVCERCGAWSDEVRVEGDEHLCPGCGYRRRFRRLRLFAVTGASGAGKTACGNRLPAALPECVVLEQDLLWRNEYAASESALAAYRRGWLRMAMNIAQGGRQTVLVGTVLPDQFECLPERRFFSEIQYAALVCSAEVLEKRLRARPAWRGYDRTKIEQMFEFNEWIVENANTTSPALTLLDTTRTSVDETVASIVAWVRSRGAC
jgi:broad-specificity NMP kinase